VSVDFRAMEMFLLTYYRPYLQKDGYFRPELFLKLWTWNIISPWSVDRRISDVNRRPATVVGLWYTYPLCLCTAQSAWRSASRGFLCSCWDLSCTRLNAHIPNAKIWPLKTSHQRLRVDLVLSYSSWRVAIWSFEWRWVVGGA